MNDLGNMKRPSSVWRVFVVLCSFVITWISPGLLQLFLRKYRQAAVLLAGFYAIPIFVLTFFSNGATTAVIAVSIKYLTLVVALIFSVRFGYGWSAPRASSIKILSAAFVAAVVVWLLAIDSVWLFRKSGSAMEPILNAGDFVVVKSVRFSQQGVLPGGLILFDRDTYLDIRKVVDVVMSCPAASKCYQVCDGKGRIESDLIEDERVLGLVVGNPFSLNRAY